MRKVLFQWNELEEIKGFIRWLISPKNSNLLGVEDISTNTREDYLQDKLFLALKGDNFDAHDFIESAIENKVRAICIEKLPNPSVLKKIKACNIPTILVGNTLKYYQELAAFNVKRFPDLKIISITGSVGKTSVKGFLAAILNSAFPKKVLVTKGNTNNHIGVPQNLLRINASHKYAVIELGTNHPEEIKVLASMFLSNIAVITSIAPAHIEFFKSLNGVAEEKSDIFISLKKNGTAIIPEETKKYDSIIKKIGNKKVITFSSAQSADCSGRFISGTLNHSRCSFCIFGQEESIVWKVIGKHQAVNASAALACAYSLGLKFKDMLNTLTSVKVLDMRLSVKKINSINWINDAYNANPASMLSALEYMKELRDVLKGQLFIVLGDMLELGETEISEHKSILQWIKDHLKGVEVITVGNIFAELSPLFFVKNYKTADLAAKYISKVLSCEDTVLLKGSRGIKLETIIDYSN